MEVQQQKILRRRVQKQYSTRMITCTSSLVTVYEDNKSLKSLSGFVKKLIKITLRAKIKQMNQHFTSHHRR